MQSPPFPRYLVPPRSKYFPQHPVLKHPHFLPSRSVNDQVSHPHLNHRELFLQSVAKPQITPPRKTTGLKRVWIKAHSRAGKPCPQVSSLKLLTGFRWHLMSYTFISGGSLILVCTSHTHTRKIFKWSPSRDLSILINGSNLGSYSGIRNLPRYWSRRGSQTVRYLRQAIEVFQLNIHWAAVQLGLVRELNCVVFVSLELFKFRSRPVVNRTLDKRWEVDTPTFPRSNIYSWIWIST